MNRLISAGLKSLTIIFLMSVLFTSSAPAQDIEKLNLKNIKKAEIRLLDQLDRLEQDVEKIESKLIRSRQESNRIKKLLKQEKKELKKLAKVQKITKKKLMLRIKSIYRLKDGGMMRILVDANSIQDMVHKYRYLGTIIRYDEEVIKRYEKQRLEIGDKIQLIKASEKRAGELTIELRVEKRHLIQTRAENTALLMKVHQRKSSYLALVKTREESHKQLIKEVIINPAVKKEVKSEQVSPAKIKDKPKPETPEVKQVWPDFAKLKGRLPMPVSGKITGRFGKTRGKYGTYTNRKGVTIMGRSGAPVRTVTSGKVIFADWVLAYGNVLIIDHGSRYYTLTAGMTDFRPRVGSWVKKNEVIGIVPSSGKSKQKGIYLEIRHRSKAMDPRDWLSAKALK